MTEMYSDTLHPKLEFQSLQSTGSPQFPHLPSIYPVRLWAHSFWPGFGTCPDALIGLVWANSSSPLASLL